MKAGLMEIVRSLNRSWIDDTYFSLYRPIHPEGKVRGGKCPDTANIDMLSWARFSPPRAAD